MKITNEQQPSLQAAGVTSAQQKEFTLRTKNFQELSSGETFKATVKDIQPNNVSLVLENGNTLGARSLVLPDARIGDEAIFLVKENIKGQILLEMLRPDGNNPREGIVREALNSADMINTKENTALVHALIQNELPIDSTTLQKAAFFKYFGEGMSLDKILFLLKEDFPASANTVNNLNGIINNTLNLNRNIGSLIEQLLNLSDFDNAAILEEIIEPGEIINKLAPERREAEKALLVRQFLSDQWILSEEDLNSGALVKERLSLLFLDSQNLTEEEQVGAKQRLFAKDEANAENSAVLKQAVLKEILTDKLFIHLKDNSADKPLNDYYNNLKQIATVLKNNLAGNHGGKEQNAVFQRITENTDNILNNLHFADNISNFKEYMHIPFLINGQTNESELHIFKRRKGEKDFNEYASILLSLDYAYLGRLEVFVNKAKTVLTLQFKAEEDSILKVIGANAGKLSQMLNEKGYSISQLSLKKQTEQFDVADYPEKPKKEEAVKRYSFDMHV